MKSLSVEKDGKMGCSVVMNVILYNAAKNIHWPDGVGNGLLGDSC